ncbi:G-protein coupled receptor 182 [Latimeria chalumnae]|uniref:G protein-coupled receptor 182 n=1 Tax=Latimeria chalumnae TaxID=7897 RepID=H3BHJ1_LATCH|nr:PREDICTED: G-protein coupled receptor 182-like [Latimeria chalumnae]|eukprot:XP_005986391.1 PREDICTED: G-protein coupled receptor 182-like [Latimeria chalumnae]
METETHSHLADGDYYHDNYTDYDYCLFEGNTNVRNVVLFLLFLVIFVLGLIGNSIVVWVNWKRRHSKDSLIICVLNMAIADLALIVLTPFWMADILLDRTWYFGKFLCQAVYFAYLVNMFSSVFFLTYMSVGRYLSLKWPLHAWDSRQQKIRKRICVGLWVLAIVLSIPEGSQVNIWEWGEPGCFFMPPADHYVEWVVVITFISIIFAFLIPSIFITTANLLTVQKMKSSSSNVQGLRKYKIIYVYIVVFLVCWMPRHVIVFLVTFHDLFFAFSCTFTQVIYFCYDIADCISCLHCVINPVLYNFLSKSFRNSLINAVVQYLPKDHTDKQNKKEVSTSSTKHSVVFS